MASLYHHPLLWDRLKDCGVVDRFVRGVKCTHEHVVSVYAATSPEGIVGHMLSVQLVTDGKQVLSETPLAFYPHQSLPLAEEDGKVVSAKLHLSLRTADPRVGWQTVSDPDGPKVIATASDDILIG